MELRQLSEHAYFFKSAVNIGYTYKDGKGLLIDSGLDKGAAKKVMRLLQEENLPLDYLILTHAHTDHYGGAAQLKKDAGVQAFAPELESAIMEYPMLEPVYLWNGAVPVKQLRNKFLEGEPVAIDGKVMPGDRTLGPFNFHAVDLPGHSYAQIGILFEGIFYAADSYFGLESLQKHKVPFIVDANSTIQSLLKIRSLSFKGAVPGHGEYEEDIEATLQANLDCHHGIKKFLLERIQEGTDGISMDTLMKKMLDSYRLKPREIGQWLLYRTAFTAYISSLAEDGDIEISVQEQILWLKTKDEMKSP